MPIVYILALLLLAAQIWAVTITVGSTASVGVKVAWILAIFFLPLIGLIAWLLIGPR